MPRFFVNDTEEFGKTAVIRGRDAEHIRVLRLRPGDDPHDAGNVRRRGPAEQQLLVHDGKDTKLSRGVIRTRQNFRTGDNS